MSSAAGWYPDPYGPGTRYWDGQRWTEQSSPPGQSVPNGQNGPQPQAEQPSNYTPPHRAEASPYGESSGLDGAALGVVGVLALVLVLALGGLIAVLATSHQNTTPSWDLDEAAGPQLQEPAPEDAASPEETTPEEPEETMRSQPAEEDTSLVLGQPVQLSLSRHTPEQATLTVEEPGPYHIYTTSSGTVDPVLDIYGPAASHSADDGGSPSSNGRDAGLRLSLEPGEYEIEVSEYYGDPAEVTLTAESVEFEEISTGRHDFSVAPGEEWVRVIDVSALDTLTVDVRSSDGDGDAVLEASLPGGLVEDNDDRGSRGPDTGNVFDPYLQLDAPEDGTATIIISGYSGQPVEGEVRIEVR
ncbi:DUF2510 domain-containing protein [Nesterenkonia sp.]|uniref:DUF2510 domain-containing protein n=1 Tax=Nesterenkonia sp. TaxID=704201 RepID=UPI002611514D|nr:DUF2510 domain-containing protein [Nesterenkonia sp.]